MKKYSEIARENYKERKNGKDGTIMKIYAVDYLERSEEGTKVKREIFTNEEEAERFSDKVNGMIISFIVRK